MTGRQFGLRATVTLYGTVVEQTMFWGPKRCSAPCWKAIDVDVPTADGASLGEYRWTDPSTVEIRIQEQAHSFNGEDERWSWTNGSGVDVEFDRIPVIHARRSSSESLADVALFVMMLTLFAGVGQLNYLFRVIAGERVESETALSPSPELIARLLKEEFSGAERGTVARAQRPDFQKRSRSYYLPAGSAGSLERAGGGALADLEARRTPPAADEEEFVDAQAGQVDLVAQVEPVDETATQAPGLEGMHPEPLEIRADKAALPPSVEEFVGWGFHDWLNVAESDDPTTREMRDRLHLARDLMRIDPDDPFAILTVAYYAYLSENYQLCRDLYGRYVSLYPEDTAGYNNLALTFKRTREYPEEEGLYRLALSLDAANVSAKNNLAVNLAHQGRFLEAESLMQELELMTPGEPYAELHRAKIAASAGRNRRAYRHLKEALVKAGELDTFHHIEFRQDIRLDPSFDRIRHQGRFRRLVKEAYGEDATLTIGLNPQRRGEVAGG